ncbi:MAG TPA: ATP-binding protein, partial [Geminicoccaceae bacterium]|nr:ATP-binding protein [Geminicoccaceae bacterium]
MVPRSLFSRSLLIVLMPLLILQAVLAYIFYERHWDSVTRWLASGFAGEVGLVVELLEAAPTAAEKSRVLDLARDHLDFAISLEPDGVLHREPATTALDRRLALTFAGELDRPFAIDTRPVAQPRQIAIYVQLKDGLLRVLAPRKRVDSTTTQVFIGWMIGMSALLLALAIYFMNRQVQPILRLARAVDQFGKGRDVGDFKLDGPTEIRQAGAAFNLMRKRILRHIGQRTEMLAAVSHDLRTPLTRMRLELEMLADGQAQQSDLEGLRADLDEMVNVVDGYLAFARGEGQEAIVATDLGSLLQEVAQRASAGRSPVLVELESPVTLPLRPVAMRRCLTNLVQNAVRHARWVGIRVAAQGDHVWIAIDDDGPGIPADQREAVFKPFYRLEASRNPSTGGVGLGLTIARDIVLGHGGDIELTEAP